MIQHNLVIALYMLLYFWYQQPFRPVAGFEFIRIY